MLCNDKLLVIGLGGDAGVGKDTLADMLVMDDPSKKTVKIAFAEPLKELCYLLTGWLRDGYNRDHINSHLKQQGLSVDQNCLYFDYIYHVFRNYFKPFGINTDSAHKMAVRYSNYVLPEMVNDSISPRRLFQLVGTEVCRGIIDSIWMDCFSYRLDKYQSDGVKCIIVSDVRFHNEVKYLLDRYKAKMFYIVSDDLGLCVNKHSSEGALLDIKHKYFTTIVNNYTNRPSDMLYTVYKNLK